MKKHFLNSKNVKKYLISKQKWEITDFEWLKYKETADFECSKCKQICS